MKQTVRLIALAALALLLALPALVLAQGRVIIDDTTGSVDTAAVQRAAQALTAKGATVVVLVSDQTGGDSQAYTSQRLQRYNIKASPLEPSAIIYLVALDQRNVFIYYGADWNATLGPAYKTIADRDMIPQLARGNTTQGLVAGIAGTVDAIENPPGAPISLAPIALAIVVVALLAIGVPLLVRSLGKRRALARALAQAQQAATDARQRAGVAIADFAQALGTAREKAQYDQLSYAPADVQQIGQWQAAAESQFAAAQERFDTAGEALAARATPAQADYEAAAQAYDQATQAVQGAREQIERAEARRAELDQLNASAPGEVDRPKKALADAAAQLQALGQEFPNAQAILRPLEDMLAQAEALLAGHRAAEAIAAAGAASATIDELNRTLARYADIREGISAGRAAAEKVAGQGYHIDGGMAAFARAEDLLGQAAAILDRDAAGARDRIEQAEAARAEGVARGGGMPALRQANDQRLPQVRAATTQATAAITGGRDAFALVHEFAEATWSDIRGNGSEAEAAAGRAGQLIERAAQRNTMQAQDFAGAQADLAAAEQQLGFVHALIEAILQRLSDLQAARTAARAEVAAAQADFDAGWSYVRSNDPDVGKDPEASLRQAGALLEQANAELQQPRPNWLAIVKQAQQANHLADQAIANARSEVDAMNALRAQAQRAQQLAAGEAQKIAQFVGLHENDLPGDSPERLAQLQAEIQQAYATLQAAERDEEAARAADLRQAISAYTTVEQHAEALYQQLYTSFTRTDQLRRQLASEVESAERALTLAEQRYNTYTAYLASGGAARDQLRAARAMLDAIGNPHGENRLAQAVRDAAAARAAAERAGQLINDQISRAQRTRPGERLDDVLAGALIGSILSGDHGRHGGHGRDHGSGSGSGGWGSGGGSLGGWGGGGGGGWGGGGGGGGGWGGGGGGGGGW